MPKINGKLDNTDIEFLRFINDIHRHITSLILLNWNKIKTTGFKHK